MQIRPINANDRALYVALAEEFYHSEAVLHPVPKQNIEAAFDEMIRSDAYLVCCIFEEDGETVGYAQLAKTFSQECGGMVAWLEELYVRPAYRGKGYANAFMAALDGQLSPAFCRIRLEVTDGNDGAVRLYERHGFERFDYMQMVKERGNV